MLFNASLQIAFVFLMTVFLSAWPLRRNKKPHSERNISVIDDGVEWGITLASMGKLNEACNQFREVLNTNSTNEYAHYNLAIALEKLGDALQAKLHLEKAISLNPDFSDALVMLGYILIELGEIENACSILLQAVNLNNSDKDAHFNLGIALFMKKDYKDAAKYFRNALKIDQTDLQTRFNLAMTLHKAGYTDLAQIEFKSFVENCDEDNSEHTTFAKKYLLKNKNTST